MLAHISTPSPARRVAKAATTFSLGPGPSTERNWVFSSVKSIADQTISSVSGLSANTASRPSPPRINVAAHGSGSGKFLRAVAVRITAKVSVETLKASGHVSESAVNERDSRNRLAGSQCGNWKVSGKLNCQANVLPQPISALPAASSQEYFNAGRTQFNTTNASATRKSSKTVRMINIAMCRQFYQVWTCSAYFIVQSAPCLRRTPELGDFEVYAAGRSSFFRFSSCQGDAATLVPRRKWLRTCS